MDNKTIKQLLYENQDLKYQKFHAGLLNDKTIKLIGVRTPVLKKMAKEISKNDYQSFIKNNKHEFYEENILHGLILGYIKVGEEELLKMVDDFIPYIDNWAVNDIVSANLKSFKNIEINKINKYIESSNPWEIRFGLTLLLNHYINKDNLKTIYKICDNIKSDFYYVKMAIAWLLSICYIKYPKETLNYLKQANIDVFTYNKTISKICDSYRVTKEDKNYLKTLRRN